MTKASTTERLRLASIEITQRCDGRCGYCEQVKADRDMPLSRYERLLDELVDEGVEAVALGGGEPTLYPQLPALLTVTRHRGLRVGLTTNARDPGLAERLCERESLDSFGVSAGKGNWLELVNHPCATVNLLLVRGGQGQVCRWAATAVSEGAHCLLLLGYKGSQAEFSPPTMELADTYAMLCALGRVAKVTIAADDYARRRLGLSTTCGEGFVRIHIDGTRDRCCFPDCEFRT